MVQLDEQQQEAIGLRTATVSAGRSHDILTAPGRVAPDETQYAFITPRAAGVVRTVTAYVGQDVKAGDLLATIDSPEVGDARLELYTRLQALELAEAQAAWQETIFGNTLELIDRLQKGERPEKIHDAFADRAVGENRERLMTAYAQYRLALARIERNRELYAQKLITPKQFEQVNADYEVAQATYQSLMDQMGYESRLANTRAQQALKQAETAVRATRERLRILGVKPDGTEPEVARGKVVGVKPDGTLPDSGKGQPGAKAKPEAVLPPERGKEGVAVEPVGATPRTDTEGPAREHLFHLGTLRRDDPRPRDNRPGGRRRSHAPDLHDGQSVDGLRRGRRPRGRLRHVGSQSGRDDPVPLPGISRPGF